MHIVFQLLGLQTEQLYSKILPHKNRHFTCFYTQTFTIESVKAYQKDTEKKVAEEKEI